MKTKPFFIFLIILIVNFTTKSQQIEEMRGVWITTAYNIDWPSTAYLSSAQQKAEFIKLLDFYTKNGINAVFLQVRPAADAFYKSTYEPWSQWLTGTQGKAPNPYYDPLSFMVAECHKRDIEFHAWFNPYRAVANTNRTIPVANHITNLKPDWFIKYGNRKYFDPGVPDVRDYVTKVIMDVVRRYDIDGVHFDDYFYPQKKDGVDFPDNHTFIKYNSDFSIKKADWRRDNVNSLIQMVGDSINAVKPQVKFGISPGGIWRNKGWDIKGSNTRGLSSYDDLFADVITWLENGWIDYVTPQIYWYIGFKIADYKHLVNWWSKNTFGRHLYIGIGVHRINSSERWKNPSEIPNQIRLNRKTPNVLGSVFFNSSSLYKNKNGFVDSLNNDLFKFSASVPKMPWKEELIAIVEHKDTNIINVVTETPIPLAPIEFEKKRFRREVLLSWNMDKSQKHFLSDTASYYRIYRFKGTTVGELNPANIYATTKKNHFLITRRFAFFRKKFTFVVAAINRNNKAGKVSNQLIVKMKR